MTSEETVFCINCGTEMSSTINFCPECESTQNPEKLEIGEGSSGEEGFSFWAPGFEPGSTIWNVAVGIVYLTILPIGVFVLIYGYLKENPESSGTFAWILGILFILAGLGSVTEGTGQSIVSGFISVVIGVVLLPIVREGIGIGSPPPGIEEENSARRNALIRLGYGVSAIVVAGLISPENEPSDSSGASESGSGSGSSGTNDGTSGTDGGAIESDPAEINTKSAEQMLPTIDQFDAGWMTGGPAYNSTTQTAETDFYNEQALVVYKVTKYDSITEAEEAYDQRVSQIRQEGLATDDGRKGDEGMLYKYSDTNVIIEFREKNVVAQVTYYNEYALTPELNTDSMARKLERNIN
jgi:hypothetical protein